MRRFLLNLLVLFVLFFSLSSLVVAETAAQESKNAQGSTVEIAADGEDAFSDDLNSDDADSSLEDEISDPLEGYNRAMFWFNDHVDMYLFEPVARGYDSFVPDPVQDGVTNFFKNLAYPKYLVSDLVQLKFKQALHHTGRFLINTTVGIGGLIDVAEEVGLPHHYEDFGSALGYHGVGSGAYIVLPLLGPSNLRDAFGRGVDVFLNPLFYLGDVAKMDWQDEWIAQGSARGLEAVDDRANLIEAIEAAKESSLDYYLFLQGAYYQHRKAVIFDLSEDNQNPFSAEESGWDEGEWE